MVSFDGNSFVTIDCRVIIVDFYKNIKKKDYFCRNKKKGSSLFLVSIRCIGGVSHGVMLLVDRDTFGVGGRSVPTLRT